MRHAGVGFLLVLLCLIASSAHPAPAPGSDPAFPERAILYASDPNIDVLIVGAAEADGPPSNPAGNAGAAYDFRASVFGAFVAERAPLPSALPNGRISRPR